MPLFDAAALEQYANPAALTQQAPPQPPDKTGMALHALITMLAGQGADAGTTLAMLRDPRFREANPLGLKGVMALKAGLVPLIWLLSRDMRRTPANIMGYAAGTAGGIPAALNLHTYATTPPQ